MIHKTSRRDFLAEFGGICAGTLLFSKAPVIPPVHASGRKPPNIVFIFADDMGWGDLPCYGHRSVAAHGGWTVRGELKMPNLDRMAAEGTMFTQFYVNSAVCSPSRTAIMTGQYPGRLGIHDYLANSKLNSERGMPDFVNPDVPTLTSLLHDQAGYRTGHFGKWHLGNGDSYPPPEEYGIDSYHKCLDGPKKRIGSSEKIADETIAFMKENQNRPFYINAWLYDPHSPLRPTEEMLAEYASLHPGWDGHYGALQVWYSVLTEMDRHIGRILDSIDELGIGGETLVIFSSDNGPSEALSPGTSHYAGVASTGPFRGMKRSLYEGGVRMPFILRQPGTVPAGQVDNKTILSGVDFLPTFCRLGGVPENLIPTCDGEDMRPALTGQWHDRTSLLMWENRFPVNGSDFHKSPMYAVRDRNWKLLMNPDGSRTELYDIPNDSTELENLAWRHPDIVTKLSKQILAWRETLPAGPVHPLAGSNKYPWPEED